jgi:hypothetical protein
MGMWRCSKCDRVFEHTGQMHSCHKVPLAEHFKNKELAEKLFDHLVGQIEEKVGKSQIISLPCCVHLFGKYDFLAALPKRDGLEIRFTLDRKLDTPRLKISVPVSAKAVKNCFDIKTKEEIDMEMLKWLDESYHLKG